MWEEHNLGIFKRVRFSDGAHSGFGETVWRRQVNGEWQYKPLTEAEEAELQGHRSW